MADGSQKLMGSSGAKPSDLPRNKDLAALIAERMKKDPAAIQSSSILVPAPKNRKQTLVADLLKKISMVFSNKKSAAVARKRPAGRSSGQNRRRNYRTHSANDSSHAGGNSVSNPRNRRRRPGSGTTNNRRRRPDHAGNHSGNNQVQRP